MKKIKMIRDISIKGIHHSVGKIAEVTEGEAINLVGMGRAIYDSSKDEVIKKKK